MSVKYILIPYDKYQNLLFGRKDHYLENAIDKYKNSPLYNAAVGQYLHHLKTPTIPYQSPYPEFTQTTQQMTPYTHFEQKTPVNSV